MENIKASNSQSSSPKLVWWVIGIVVVVVALVVLAYHYRPNPATMPWFEYWYYIAGIATPLVALVGFVFVWKQISIAKNQAETAQQQLQQEIETRRMENLPVFALAIGTWSSGPAGIQYTDVRLTNCGSRPALYIKSYIEHGSSTNPTVIQSVEFQAIVAQETQKLAFPTFPVQPPFAFNYIVEYENIFGEKYRQTWKIDGSNVTVVQPPTMI